MREAVENGFPANARVVTGLKAGVNEKLQLGSGVHARVKKRLSWEPEMISCCD